MPDPIPGQFHNGEDSTFDGKEMVNDREILPEISDSEVADLNAFNDEFKPKSDLVYYPCCGSDISPSKVFSGRIKFLDQNEKDVNALKKAGYNAYQGDANTFDPGNVDIMVVYNPQISPESLLQYVNENGYLVCNNYHSTANLMSRRNDFEFKGAVDKDDKIDRKNLNDYWQKVETDEELFQSDPMVGRFIQDIVLKLTGKSDNILQNYRQILDENPNGMVLHEGNTIMLWDIPMKKKSGTYIFQRREEK